MSFDGIDIISSLLFYNAFLTHQAMKLNGEYKPKSIVLRNEIKYSISIKIFRIPYNDISIVFIQHKQSEEEP